MTAQTKMNMLALATAQAFLSGGTIDNLEDWSEMEGLLRFELYDSDLDVTMVHEAIEHVRRRLYSDET